MDTSNGIYAFGLIIGIFIGLIPAMTYLIVLIQEYLVQ